jgi:hypothetical protein
MMCHPCRQAGEVLKLTPSEEHPDPESEAIELHRMCQESNCTCQHRTDKDIINRERIPSSDSQLPGTA